MYADGWTTTWDASQFCLINKNLCFYVMHEFTVLHSPMMSFFFFLAVFFFLLSSHLIRVIASRCRGSESVQFSSHWFVMNSIIRDCHSRRRRLSIASARLWSKWYYWGLCESRFTLSSSYICIWGECRLASNECRPVLVVVAIVVDVVEKRTHFAYIKCIFN